MVLGNMPWVLWVAARSTVLEIICFIEQFPLFVRTYVLKQVSIHCYGHQIKNTLKFLFTVLKKIYDIGIISKRLFELALLIAVQPGMSGSSGTLARYLSSSLLNAFTEILVRFLSSGGRMLKSRGPLTDRHAYRMFLISVGALFLIDGKLHLCPS